MERLEDDLEKSPKNCIKDQMSGDEKDVKVQDAIILIYKSSVERIFKVTDKVARGIVHPDEELAIENSYSSLNLPEKEEWDFRLGDTVRIKLRRDDFKWIQKKTVGWQNYLNQLIGLSGIVTNVSSRFANAIGVYFPDVLMDTALYAGVLEKAPPRKDPCLSRRWKVGEYVTTISDQKVLALLQRGWDEIPKKYIGVTGKVVGVTHPCIHVTFNNSSTFKLKSRCLIPSTEAKVSDEHVDHPRGFGIGEEVTIISNLKKLIDQQKDAGGWNADMTPICGAKGRIIQVQDNKSVIVQTQHMRAWRLNSDSVVSLDKRTSQEDNDSDLPFIPEDVVKVSVPRDINRILYMAEIPYEFLEYIRSPAVVALVDNDLNYYIRFNGEQHLQTHGKFIKKAIPSEREAYKAVQNLTENIKVGDPVYLDIGPPNLVRSVTAKLKLNSKVAMALTRSAILEGYINRYTAVIRYKDGTRIRINKKFLTVPQKFYIDDAESRVSLRIATIESISNTLSRCVQEIHNGVVDTTDESKVVLAYMHEGHPPCVEFRVKSTVADFKSILEWFESNSGYTTEVLGDGQFVISGIDKPNRNLEVKIGVIFNDEDSYFKGNDTSESNYKAQTVSGSVTEDASPDAKARPFNAENLQHTPMVNSMEQFRFMRLHDSDLAENVYLPYVILSNRRTTVQFDNGRDQPPFPNMQTQNKTFGTIAEKID